MKYCMKAILLAAAVGWSSSLLLAAGTHPTTGEALTDDQIFTYVTIDEHTSVDPQIVEDVAGAAIVRDLFEGLYNQDADGNLVPGVALSHATNADKTVYTFTLRNNAKWSDGRKVTAGDFEYAWKRLADPETASSYQWFMGVMNIKNADDVMSGDIPVSELGVKALTDTTLEVTLASSMSYFPLTTTHGSTFPSPQWAIKAHGANWVKPEHIVSNGAYVLTKHVPNETLVRERNPMYWNDADTIMEKVVIKIVNDENVALTRYLAGEFDKTGVPTGQFARMQTQYPEEVYSNPTLCTYYYNLNMGEHGPEALKDKRVRQALSYAIDRDIIVENILQAGQFPAYTFTPDATAGFTVPEVAVAVITQAERDTKAAELLSAAGYGKDNPLSIEILYNTSEGHKKIAIAISQMWKQKLGVEASMQNQEWKTFLTTRGEGNYEVARGGWCGDYNEASTFLDLVNTNSGYNDSKFSNEEVDQLLADSKTSDNPQPNYTRIEEIVADEAPLISIYHYTSAMFLKLSVKGWPHENVEGNWYSRNLYKVAE
ncbi:MAG: peptide ABC transporter substrate-binding protein [Woeseiaceae bacterium]|nr:peptide ABC transporter substrate-binding protein [Woeseiaceae bacterium]